VSDLFNLVLANMQQER